MQLKKKLLGIVCFLSIVIIADAQSALSTATLRNMKNVIAPFSTITKKDSLILVCFWATSSDESINELNAINAKIDQWKEAVKFRMIAVSTDEGKLANKVRPTINMNGWTFEVFVDINGDLRKAVNANNLPQSMIIKGDKVVYQQSGYEAGSENYLLQKLQAIAAGIK
jgi:cytochrome c biogenesis protein CcmG, thiol:disulfide interchange protein DsbE